MPYGYELILDLEDCNTELFTREFLDIFFKQICEKIDMEQCECYYWDDLDVPEGEKQIEDHTIGTSAVQFILTSSIVIHTLDRLGMVFINIFSCKKFNAATAELYCRDFFQGMVAQSTFLDRGWVYE